MNPFTPLSPKKKKADRVEGKEGGWMDVTVFYTTTKKGVYRYVAYNGSNSSTYPINPPKVHQKRRGGRGKGMNGWYPTYYPSICVPPVCHLCAIAQNETRHVSDTRKCGSLTFIFTHPPEDKNNNNNN